MQKNRLRNLLNILSPDETSVDFTEFDSNVEKLKTALKEKVQAKTLQDVDKKLEQFKARIDFKPLTDSITLLKDSVDKKIGGITKSLKEYALEANAGNIAELSISMQEMRKELGVLNAQSLEIQVIQQRIDALPDAQRLVNEALTSVRQVLAQSAAENEQQDAAARDALVTNYTNEIEKLRRELTNRINNMPHGGNANRNIAIGGNSSVLSKYGDINFKAGADITLTYANNETTKQLDVTIAGTGGTSVGYQQPTGSVDGVNQIFIFPIAPNVIAVDNGRVIQKVSSDTTVNWTGTTTVTLSVAPAYDIFGVS